MSLARSLRRWWKCRVRGLHYYQFAHKNADGSRLLSCVRCNKSITTRKRHEERTK